MNKSQIINVENKEQMAHFARNFAHAINQQAISSSQPTTIIGLSGTLGAGKSFFAKHFINELQENKTEILSPTFNIALTYDTKLGEIYHFDLYRIKNKDELENIGFFDAIKNNICLIEWPDIALDYLKTLPNFALLKFEISGEEERVVSLT